MKRTFTLFLFLLLSATAAIAGGLMKTDSQSQPYLFPEAIEVSTTIRNQVAITITKQTFTNSVNGPVRLSFLFPTPINAAITGLRWWQNGELREAQISGKPQDTAVLGNPNSGGTDSDPRLTNHLGQSPLIFPFRDSLPANGTIVVELTYVELLRYGGGKVGYFFPMDMSAFGAGNIKLDVSIALQVDRDLLSIASLSHPEIGIVSTSRSANSTFSSASIPSDRNLELRYALAQNALGVTLLSNKPAGEDGYFLMLAEPDPQTSQQKVLDKIFTFVIDVSGSMSGTKLEQAKEAARYTIEHLNPDDHFNVVKFSDLAAKFQPAPVPATLQNVRDGVRFIDALVPEGGTNLQGAVLTALAQEMPDTTWNVIVFLTDGLASIDQQAIAAANRTNTRIFVFGIGRDVNTSLLTQLALNNNGTAEFLGTDDVSKRIPEFYNRIRNPLLQNISLSFSAGEVYEIYPLPLPDIYVGEQLVVLGRYKQPGDARAMLKGKSAGNAVALDYDVHFTGDSLVDIFIPKMWAKYKIDALLVMMRTVGQNSNQWKEWRDEIIRLSRAYGILSPFSSFSDPGSGNGGNGGASTVEPETPRRTGTISLRSFPNPFRAATTLTFAIPNGAAAHTTITIYDMAGRVVAVVTDEMLEPGPHEIAWHGRDALGNDLPAGVYLCEIRIGGETHIERLVLMR